MNEEQILLIPLEQIQPSEGNRRIGGFDPAKLQQLADSIRAVGVQQPAVVRHGAASNGNYELVTGERRWRAARMAGLETLPCVVRELDDVTVLKIQTIENLQREDIHPLDEADGYARLIERAGYDVDHLAQEVGRSASYVYQRLKLRDLIPSARKLLVDGVIQAGHAILIARLQPPEQNELLSWLRERSRWNDRDVSVRELDEHIHRTILLDLAKAPFKREDADLVPEAGACATCAKRTGSQPALFADVCNGKRDYCTDPGCFQGKLSALVIRRRQELAEQPHLEVSTSWSSSYNEEQRLAKESVKIRNDWEECKRTDKGAVRCLVVHGEDRGRLTWGRERQKGRGERYEPTEEEKRVREKEARERKVRAAIRQALWDAVTRRLEGFCREDLPTEILRMVAQHLWERTWDNSRALYCRTMGWEKPKKKQGEYSHGWQEIGREQIGMMTKAELRKFLVTCSVIDAMDASGYRSELMPKELEQLGGLLKLDVKALEASAKQEVIEKAAAPAKKAARK
jgi:ParB family chromosome partitioning protein